MALWKTKKRVDKAQTRYDKAQKKYWDLLGWGTSAEVQQANDALSKARKNLVRIKESYERLMHQDI